MIAIRNRLYSILLGGSLLPKCNLIFNWKTGYDEKVAGNTPKVLHPCFKGDGSKTIELPAGAYTVISCSKDDGIADPVISGNTIFFAAGQYWDLVINDGTSGISFPLIGHAYGFKSDGTVITGTPSDDSCFTGLCEYNPEEGYNKGLGCTRSDEIAYYPSNQAYGVWEFSMYNSSGSKNSCANYFISDDNSNPPYHSSNGYIAVIYSNTSANRFAFIRNNVGSSVNLMATASDYLQPKTWYQIRVTRELDGDFKFEIKSRFDTNFLDWTLIQPSGESLVNGVYPHNPINDNTYQISNFQILDLDEGDKIYNIKDNNGIININNFIDPTNAFNTIPIPQSRIDPTKDVLGADLVDFLGSKAIAPYCGLEMPILTNDVFNRTDTTYWDVTDLAQFGVITEYPTRGFLASTFMEGAEFIKSLMNNWQIFFKTRDTDSCIVQIVAYKLPEIDYAQRVKVLKATKDKVTDVTDYALYINSNSAMLNQNGVPAEVGDTVSKIHSISNELIVSQTDKTKQPMLQADGSLLFASGDEMLFKDKDGNPVSITGTVKINGTEKTLIDSSKIQYGDLDNGILISLIKE